MSAPIDSDSPAPSPPNRRGNLATGVEVIRGHLKTLPGTPGVYRMLNTEGEALYVGKAKSLRKRVVAYTHPERLPIRLQRMIAETRTMEFMTTNSEVEALLLEANLIKRLKPRYNVLLRDDKSFAHIMITGDHAFPRLVKHRGAREKGADMFGPFASAGAVNRTITALLRAFLLRNCSDSMFASRTRPCLQYQIKRCTAPCVGRISVEDYAQQVAAARAFLSGKGPSVQADFTQRMIAASESLDYETAARWRDRVRSLTAIQAHQDINLAGIDDADVIAAWQEEGHTCIQVFFFRNGSNYGNRAYFPSHDRQIETAEVLGSFLVQFYDNKPPPPLILLSHEVPEHELIAEALSLSAGRAVEVATPKRGDKRRPVEHALQNAREALARRRAESSTQARLLVGVAAAFDLEQPPQRIEVYDNSHIQGAHAVGAMIVAGPDGLIKNAYRKFNIRNTAVAGDDFGMMREVLSRRFARLGPAETTSPAETASDKSQAVEAGDDDETAAVTRPDLLLIDGGQGQLTAALDMLAEHGIDDIAVVGIAKGPDRDAGKERFFIAGREPFSLPAGDPVLYYLQRLRDEAHRFAIGAHRAKRAKAISSTGLDEVPGIGPTRRKALMLYFGSARAVAAAALSDLEAVPGISKAIAMKIHNHFQG
ncbi:UvrABC system protein C [uncultured Gammaproteobacteria bacterium]